MIIRDPYSIPASGEKKFISAQSILQPPKELLQLAALVVTTMRRGTGEPIWSLKSEVGYGDDGLSLRANAPVKHGFPTRPESDETPEPSWVELICKVGQFTYENRLFTAYTLSFTEKFNFLGGQNQDLVVATCATLAFNLREKKLIQPAQVPGFWQMQEGSWNEPHLVDAFSNTTYLAFLGVVFMGLGVVSAADGNIANSIALIRSTVLPSEQQIAESGLRLDGIYITPQWGDGARYVRFLPDGSLIFTRAASDIEAVKLLYPGDPNVSRSLYGLRGSEVRFPLWGPGWTTDFLGTIGPDGINVRWYGRATGGSGQNFLRLLQVR